MQRYSMAMAATLFVAMLLGRVSADVEPTPACYECQDTKTKDCKQFNIDINEGGCAATCEWTNKDVVRFKPIIENLEDCMSCTDSCEQWPEDCDELKEMISEGGCANSCSDAMKKILPTLANKEDWSFFPFDECSIEDAGDISIGPCEDIKNAKKQKTCIKCQPSTAKQVHCRELDSKKERKMCKKQFRKNQRKENRKKRKSRKCKKFEAWNLGYQIKQEFDKYDLNGDGVLDELDSIKTYVLQDMDGNNDGVVDEAEFAADYQCRAEGGEYHNNNCYEGCRRGRC